ncbi:VOC family protein [Caulobacter sp. FWC2]|uniref:VOC family protein n=1 Tax=Caulobacter sp. FWC2 TaxID=69664 RepID=UPI000C15C403|nr:VOC family protein [Caulobacter sp. FWC2]PIB90591.1 glyoxalase/bleomycin resistance/extradiol dioxygenase family protein [Caulobacter sp. FWC2]
MFDHMGLGVSDFTRSAAFYDAALAPLGIRQLYVVPKEFTNGVDVAGYGRERPMFWVSGHDTTQGKLHVAFAAETRAQVDAFYEAALKAGGKDNGSPGLRPHYDKDYYGAFVLDPDGFNVEAVCRAPE